MIKKKIMIGLVMAMMISGIAGCGSRASAERNKYSGDNYSYAAATEAAAEYDYESYDYELADEGGAYYEENSVSAGSGISDSKGINMSDDTTNTLPEINTEKLVYRCTCTYETTAYDDSKNSLKTLISSYNGFIENEDEYTTRTNNPSVYFYTATIRVPSQNYQAFLDNSGSLGELISKTQNVSNLSQEYNDLSAELEILEAKRTSYISMMKEAKSLNDMESLLMVDERLTDVEISINQIKTRMNSINNDVAYSYITVSIKEVREYEDPVPETFSQRISQAFKNGWKNFVEGCQNFVIWAAENIIGIVIFIVILLAIYFSLIRKPLKAIRESLRVKKAAKKAAKAAANANSNISNSVNTANSNNMNTVNMNNMNTANINDMNTANMNDMNTANMNNMNTANINDMNTANINNTNDIPAVNNVPNTENGGESEKK